MIATFAIACGAAVLLGVVFSLIGGYGFNIEAICIMSAGPLAFLVIVGVAINLYLFFAYTWNESKFWGKVRRKIREILSFMFTFFLYSLGFGLLMSALVGAVFLVKEMMTDWVLPVSCLGASTLFVIWGWSRIKKNILMGGGEEERLSQ
jgi:hypothetical protein